MKQVEKQRQVFPLSWLRTDTIQTSHSNRYNSFEVVIAKLSWKVGSWPKAPIGPIRVKVRKVRTADTDIVSAGRTLPQPRCK
jgi:hypothetical protein